MLLSPYFEGVYVDWRADAPRPKCAKEKMTIGWFSPDELSHPTSPLIVYIDAHAGGREIHVRSLYSPDKNPKWDKNYGRPETVEIIHAAYAKANRAFADALAGGGAG